MKAISYKDDGTQGYWYGGHFVTSVEKESVHFSDALSKHRKFGEVLFVVENLVGAGGEIAQQVRALSPLNSWVQYKDSS